ncbi:hypothetical protein BOSEA31B_12055 [Hyphomicrobiales bacterium]|nr:hypothetical protein BOSEA31B_12055 [Hyphomicrobiales bacterium]CAH1697834.1 hypothetical protein BOSEA1005_10879 [Hyphomicrobiales bacterium]CAI0347480.1 hypothetical protein BO1005MUT1_70261 [Hyphomicrobiales bacterium]
MSDTRPGDVAPEISETFCVAPFTTLSLYPTGLVTFCCKNPTVLGSYRDSALDELWSSPRLKQIRQSSLTGKRHPSCAHCWQLEDQNAVASWRQNLNTRLAHIVPEILAAAKPDGTIAAMPRYVEVSMSNLCNLRCRMCSPELSTSLGKLWEDKTGPGDPEGRPGLLQRPFARLDRFIDDLKIMGPSLEEVFFFGGEPLIDKNLLAAVEALEPWKSHIAASLNTNLTTLTGSGIAALERLQQFKSFNLSISIDGHRKLNEYIRVGTEAGAVERHARQLTAMFPELKLCATISPQALNILHWAETISYISQIFEPEYLSTSLVLNPLHMSVRSLPAPLKQLAAARMRRFNDDVLPTLGLNQNLGAAHVRAIGEDAIRFMENGAVSDGEWDGFRRHIAEMDTRTGQSILEVIPEFRGHWSPA